MSVKTMSEEAALLDRCSICLKEIEPVRAFSVICKDCQKAIESGKINSLIRGIK